MDEDPPLCQCALCQESFESNTNAEEVSDDSQSRPLLRGGVVIVSVRFFGGVPHLQGSWTVCPTCSGEGLPTPAVISIASPAVMVNAETDRSSPDGPLGR